jgi:mono/diheme cytochrome c family protein
MHRTRLLALLSLVALLAGLLSACGGSASTTTQAPTTSGAGTTAAADGAALLQARCTVCHNLDRVQSKHEAQDWWAGTVARMVGKGAQLSEAEKATLVAYLAATFGP